MAAKPFKVLRDKMLDIRAHEVHKYLCPEGYYCDNERECNFYTVVADALQAARDEALEEGRLKLQRTDKARVAWREAADPMLNYVEVLRAGAKARALDAECEEGNDVLP